MKVLVINIALRPKSEKVLFPIGLAYILTAIEKAGFNFELLDLDVLRPTDQELEEIIKKKDFDVVAFGCIVTGYKYVKKLAELIKKYKDVPIIAGNSVAASIPEILMLRTKVDIGVIGEGDITIVELLKAIENKKPLEEVKGIFFGKDGKIFFTKEREIILNLNELSLINYDLFDIKVYLEKCKLDIPEPYPVDFELLKVLPINTARGCPFNCTFCYHVFKRKRYRMRSVNHIGQEIKLLKERYGVNYIQFLDELTLFTKEQASNFADYFIKEKLNIYWTADCRAGLFKENDLDLALKLKEAGCVSLGYSLESADEEILKAMDKRITVQDFVVQTKVIQKAGIITATSLVIGYPTETEETIKKTFDCCYGNNIYPSAGFLLPQPGTPMYEYALQKGIIKDEEEYLLNMGDRQDFHVNFTKMSQERMEELVKEHLKRISDKMNLGLKEEQLIKTGHYRQKLQDNRTKQLEAWEGEFGKAYTDRNMMTSEGADELCLKTCGIKRTDIYKKLLEDIQIDNILEVGCNIANQLILFQKMGYKNLWGIEPQEYACELAKKRVRNINIIQALAFDIPFKDNYFDLVFTSGVLEHIAPEDLPKTMAEIYRVSKKYILGFETYISDGFRMIKYRGNDDLLWRADYSKLFMERFPDLKLLRQDIYPYKPTNELDVAYLLKKGD